jgi:hypothetical protein
VSVPRASCHSLHTARCRPAAAAAAASAGSPWRMASHLPCSGSAKVTSGRNSTAISCAVCTYFTTCRNDLVHHNPLVGWQGMACARSRPWPDPRDPLLIPICETESAHARERSAEPEGPPSAREWAARDCRHTSNLHTRRRVRYLVLVTGFLERHFKPG